MRLPVLPAFVLGAACGPLAAAELPPLRPPSVPLATHTPFFSVWSPANRLTDAPAAHWTGRNQPLTGLIRIDGETFRVLGGEPRIVPALTQTGLTVTPTASAYRFADARIGLTLTFTSPLLPDDLELLARPVSYVTWDVASLDGKAHEVAVLLAADGALAVNKDEQAVALKPETFPGLACVSLANPEQPVLESKGDDHRIDWGRAYVASAGAAATTGAGSIEPLVASFAATGRLAGATAVEARAVADGRPSIAVAIPLGSTTAATATHLLAYDEIGAILYFGKALKPYWQHGGATIADALAAATKQQADVFARCAVFDRELVADATAVGGADYAALCVLAHRQAIAANGLAADDQGQPLFFPKENHSNGCIATVDVLYPQIPQLLLLSPTLAKALIVPVADYSASPLWKYPYAPHDLGTYPHATGQVYGMGGPDAGRMPVEESGNMILCFAAIAKVDGNARFADRWWPQITSWVQYLEKQGFDPENQLCTDDFAGHLAHNANLSVKAIVAIAAYGQLAGLRGDQATAAKYAAMARDFAKKWMATADDGEKYRLAFDQVGSWSQKYNLVWDRVLGLGVFPASVAEKEMAWYRRSINAYGLPLDSRKTYTKSDWTLWTSILRGRGDDVAFFSARLRDAFNEMDNRQPMTDWLETTKAHKIGFTARSVVGGYFMPFLVHDDLWKKWAARDKGNPSTHVWAQLPKPPVVTAVVPLSGTTQAVWRYATAEPATGWIRPDFDDRAWSEGKAGFGTAGTPAGAASGIATEWKESDIWLRRSFTLPAGITDRIVPLVAHDDDAEVYIDGILAGRLSGYSDEAQPMIAVRQAAQARLVPGATVSVAVHCHQIKGGQFVDVGFATVK